MPEITVPPGPPRLSLRSLAVMLFRRKLLVFTLFTAIVATIGLATCLMPRQYESRMKVLVKNERADLVVSPDARNGAQFRGDVSEQQVNSEIELLNSNDLLASVVRACRLDERTSGSVHASGEPSAVAVERAVRKLQRDLKVTPVHKANIILIRYTAASPGQAASVLRELSAGYLDAHLNIHRTAGTQQFFREQAERYENELRSAEGQLSDFRRHNGLTSIAEQKELVLRKSLDAEAELRQTDAALAEAATRVRELRQQVAAQEGRIVTQKRVVPNQYSVERLNTMLAELENRRTQALMKFHDGDRVVVEIEQEIANTRAALERAVRLSGNEESTNVNPLRQSLEGDLAHAELQQASLGARRASVAGTVAAYHGRLAQLEKDTIEHDALQRAVKESEENYLLYTRKREEARIADSLDQQKIANVAIAEAPIEQHVPTKPNVLLNLSLGVLLAGFVSMSAAFAAEYRGSYFYSPAELEAATGLPVLATVPFEG